MLDTSCISLIGPLLIGHLADSGPEGSNSNLTKDSNGNAKQSGFSIPAPRPKVSRSIPPLLSNPSEIDDDEEDIIRPWEK